MTKVIELSDGNPVDVKDLISFDMGFNKLGLVLADISGRVSKLEGGGGVSPRDSSSTRGADGDKSSNNNDESSSSPSGSVDDRLKNLEDTLADMRDKQSKQDRRLDALERGGGGGNAGGAGNNNNNNDGSSAFSGQPPNSSDNADAIDALQKQINDLHNDVDTARQAATSAKNLAGDAERKADNCHDRLRSHIRFAHGGGSGSGADASASDDNSNNNNSAEQQQGAENSTSEGGVDGGDDNNGGGSSGGKAGLTDGSSSPGELADEQARMQREIDRLAKQIRDQNDDLENTKRDLRSLHRTAVGTPSSPARMAGGGAVDLHRPFAELSRRVGALEEKQETLERLVAPKSFSSHKANSDQGVGEGDEDVASAIGQIRGHLTTHDVAIEDIQRQMAATLEALGRSGGGDGDGGGGGAPREVLAAAITALQNRIKPLEEHQKEASHSLRQLDHLRRNAATKDDLADLKKDHDYLARSTHNQLDKLEAKLGELEKLVKEHLGESNPHVSQEEFERLQNDLRRLESDLQSLANSSGGGGDKNKDGVSDVAAGMLSSRLDSAQSTLDDLAAKMNELKQEIKSVDGKLGETGAQVKTNTSRIQGLEAMVRRATDEAAHAGHDARTAGDAIEGILKRLSQLGNAQDHITDRLNHVDNAVTTMAAASARNSGGGGGGGGASAEFEKMVKAELDKLNKWKQHRDSLPDPSSLNKDLETNKDWAKGQMVDIRALIDHMRHTKADSSQVASKADRDYVENALEKLMREVEGVINSTNAGLIDTLDKSLGLLRDMIDGKATKNDVAKVKNLIGASEIAGGGAGGGNAAANQAGVASDGLLGVQSYRCLGCNRTVEHMRPRPMGAQFANFMSRVPAGGGAAGGGPQATVRPGGAPLSATGSRPQQQQQQQNYNASAPGVQSTPLLIPAPPSQPVAANTPQ